MPNTDARHEAAVALIAESNRAQGRVALEYDAETYAKAYEAVNASVRRDILKHALIEVGAADPEDETVTEELLLTRAHQILYAEGFYQYHGGNSIRLPDDETQLAAVHEAIKELGKPGEKRKDIAQLLASRRDQIIDNAISDGKIFESGRETWCAMYDADPEQIAGALAAIPVHPDIVTARKIGYEMDPASFEADQAAKLLLREAGLISATGGERYDSEQYVQAVEAVDTVGAANVVRLRDEARKGGVVGESFLWRAESIAAGVAREIKEAVENVTPSGAGSSGGLTPGQIAATVDAIKTARGVSK